MPAEQLKGILYFNDGPFTPRSHRRVLERWGRETLPTGWSLRFASDLVLAQPSDWIVKPWVGKSLLLKLWALQQTEAPCSIVLDAHLLPLGTIAEWNAESALCSDTSHVRESRVLIVNRPSDIPRGKSYDEMAEWPLSGSALPEAWIPTRRPAVDKTFLDLVPLDCRPWLNAAAPGNALWLAKLKKAEVSPEEIGQDIAKNLARPSLLNEFRSSHVDKLFDYAETALSREERARITSGEALRRMNQNPKLRRQWKASSFSQRSLGRLKRGLKLAWQSLVAERAR